MKQMIESILFINNAKRDYSQIIDPTQIIP